MSDDSYWVERAQSAEARFATLSGQIEPLKEKVRNTRESLCARERADGSFSIDFDALVQKLGIAACLELRGIIDRHYGISGAPEEKPRVKIKAEAVA